MYNYIKTIINDEFSIPTFLNKAYLPSLDGWRAVAITLVILGHLKFMFNLDALYYKFAETLIYAELGVKIFFVLSGFLITSILLKEYINYKKINITLFFLKRFFRIIPVLYLYLFVVFILSYYYQLNLVLSDFLMPSLFLTNFWFFPGTWLTSHSWTLSVEEQFYLIWPLLFRYLNKKIWLLGLLLLFIPALRILWHIKYIPFNETLGPFLTHADAIFSGCMLSFYCFKKCFNNISKVLFRAYFYLPVITILLAVQFLTNRNFLNPILIPFGSLITNTCICYLILTSVISSNNYLHKILNLKALRDLGVISYSLYIWQQLFIIPKGNPLPSFEVPINLILLLIVSIISYKYFESFFLSLRKQIILKTFNI